MTKSEKESRMYKKGFEIQAPVLGFDGSDYAAVKANNKLMAKPKKDTPMTIKHQKQFLKDQGMVKNAEQRWFDKLERELERMEMDEQLH